MLVWGMVYNFWGVPPENCKSFHVNHQRIGPFDRLIFMPGGIRRPLLQEVCTPLRRVASLPFFCMVLLCALVSLGVGVEGKMQLLDGRRWNARPEIQWVWRDKNLAKNQLISLISLFPIIKNLPKPLSFVHPKLPMAKAVAAGPNCQAKASFGNCWIHMGRLVICRFWSKWGMWGATEVDEASFEKEPQNKL